MITTRRALATLPTLTLSAVVLPLGFQPASAATTPVIPLPVPITVPITVPSSLPLPVPTGLPVPASPKPSPTVAPTPSPTSATKPVTPGTTKTTKPTKAAPPSARTVRAYSVQAVPGPATAGLSASGLQLAPVPAAVPAAALAPAVAPAPALPPRLVTPALAPSPSPTVAAALEGGPSAPVTPAVLAGVLIALAGAAHVRARRVL